MSSLYRLCPGTVRGRLCRKSTQNKDFRTVLTQGFRALLATPGNRLAALKAQSQERRGVLEAVRSSLPSKLAQAVASAGLTQGVLTVGVVGAHWASRLRYSSEPMRKRLSKALNEEVVAVRIRVLPPGSL